jgi:hypothetical protein
VVIVSDMSIPDTRGGAVSRDAIRGLAVFAGVTFVMTGITQVLAAGRVDSWEWLYLVGAVKAGLQCRAAASAGVPDSSDRGDAGPAAKP